MKIYGYCFIVTVEKGESGYVGFAPGVGGVYEEGATEEEAVCNAYEAACAILETRLERNDPITEDNPNLKVLRVPPSLQDISRMGVDSNSYVTTLRSLTPVAV